MQNDGRCSFTDIGAAVHLSANAVADRVRKLTQAGVIRGVRAVVDPAALGLTIEAQIDVKLPSYHHGQRLRERDPRTARRC